MTYKEQLTELANHWASITGQRAAHRYEGLFQTKPDTKCEACGVALSEHGWRGRSNHWFVPKEIK